MTDARQSPIPQDRVNDNIDQRERAETSKAERRQQERHLKDQGVDERPGTNAEMLPSRPAEGGD